jgi:hypothetical protein
LLDSPILFPHLHHLALKLFGLLAHALGDEAHLASLHGEEAGLIFILLDLFGAAGIGHVLFLDATRDLFDHVLVVADVLLDLLCVDIEVQNAVRECIQEFSIVRNDQSRSSCNR